MDNYAESASQAPSRERVRRLVSEGLSTREIAAIMGISTQRVNQHRRTLAAMKPEPSKASA